MPRLTVEIQFSFSPEGSNTFKELQNWLTEAQERFSPANGHVKIDAESFPSYGTAPYELSFQHSLPMKRSTFSDLIGFFSFILASMRGASFSRSDEQSESTLKSGTQ